MDFKGKSLILLEKYDEAIECYKNHSDNKNYEIGIIYYKYKKLYQKAFKCFDDIKNYKYALKSLKKLQNYENLFNYTNRIANYLGIINYNEAYIEFINFYFRKYFIERKNINEDFNKSQLPNNMTYKQIIIKFFGEYMNQIKRLENFEKTNIKTSEIENNNLHEDKLFEKFQDELKIDLDTTHFVNLYYFNKYKNFLFELIKIYPELIYFKTKIFNKKDYIGKLRIYKSLNLLDRNKNYKKKEEKITTVFSNRNIYYENLKKIINYILYHAEYNNINDFGKYIIPFLFNHGYFYYRNESFNCNSSELFWDLSLNNYDLFFNNKNFNISEFGDNNILYYLSYLLRIGITDFIQSKDKSFIKNILFKKYKFKRLERIIEELDKEADNNIKYKHYNHKYTKSIEYKEINEDLAKIFNYLVSYEKEDKKLNNEDIINYLDIGSLLSLFLITIYFNNYKIYVELTTEKINELYHYLYLLCNLISSSSINYFSYNKKLILFSLFSVFNISPLPFDDKILNNRRIFEIFNYINGCLLNCNSILFSKNFFNSGNKFKSKYFDIFSDENQKLYENKDFIIFNLEGNNIIINYYIISILFRFMVTGLVNNIFNNYFYYKFFTPNFFNFKSKTNNDVHFYSSILYYYSQLRFSCNDDRSISIKKCWTGICTSFRDLNFIFPSKKEKEKQNYFFLNDYLKDLLLYNTKPNIIYSLIINYLHEQKTGGYNINEKEINLFIFLLENIWNIKLSSCDYTSEFLKYNYFQKLYDCLNNIEKGRIYIFSSILLLRRILPLILKYFEFYFEYYFKNNQKFDIEEANICIYRHKEEKIFDYIRKIKILKEEEEKERQQKEISKLIISYFKSLIKTMKIFSEFGENYCYDESQIDFWEKSENIELQNNKGKGLYKNKIENEALENIKEDETKIKEKNENKNIENKKFESKEKFKEVREGQKENNEEKNSNNVNHDNNKLSNNNNKKEKIKIKAQIVYEKEDQQCKNKQSNEKEEKEEGKEEKEESEEGKEGKKEGKEEKEEREEGKEGKKEGKEGKKEGKEEKKEEKEENKEEKVEKKEEKEEKEEREEREEGKNEGKEEKKEEKEENKEEKVEKKEEKEEKEEREEGKNEGKEEKKEEKEDGEEKIIKNNETEQNDEKNIENEKEKENKEEIESNNNLKKEEKDKTDDKNIKINKEKDRKKEEEKIIEKNQKNIIKKNAVIFFDKLCYEDAIKKLTKNYNYLDEIKGTLEEGYNNKYDDIKANISNEFYYLFEITFFCIYLTVIEIYNEKQKEIKDKEEQEKEENESFDKNNIEKEKCNKKNENKISKEGNNEKELRKEEEDKGEVNIEKENEEKIKKEGLNLEKNKDFQKKDEYKEGEEKEMKEEEKNIEKLDKEEKGNKEEIKNEDLKEGEINKNEDNRKEIIERQENEEEVNKEINKEEVNKQKEESNEENEIIKEKIKNIKEDKRIKKERIDEIMSHIFSFITTYEKYSLYLNFIDEEGYRTYIKSKYDELFPKLSKDILYDNDYKSIEDLRKYLLKKKKFSYFDDSEEREMEIIRKEVIFVEDEKINKNCGKIDNIHKKFLFNTYNENNSFYKGSKKEIVMRFFEDIEYNEKIDTNQKNKILKEYIENYLNIIG